MNTTQVGVIIDGLIAACTNAGLNVVDGPAVEAAEIGHDVLYVGWNGTEGEAARTDQEWVGVGNKARNENGSITCYAEASRGDTAMKPTRDAAIAVVQSVETIVRADPRLAVLTQPDRAWFGGVDSHVPLQTSSGSRWGVVFHINLYARL